MLRTLIHLPPNSAQTVANLHATSSICRKMASSACLCVSRTELDLPLLASRRSILPTTTCLMPFIVWPQRSLNSEPQDTASMSLLRLFSSIIMLSLSLSVLALQPSSKQPQLLELIVPATHRRHHLLSCMELVTGTLTPLMTSRKIHLSTAYVP